MTQGSWSGKKEKRQFLRQEGYRIIARNLRSTLGELDLVAEDGSVLVFIEVKARRSNDFGGAIHAVHQRKQEKLVRLASQYLAKHHLSRRDCRFDVVLLQESVSGGPQIQHIRNAFEVPGDDLRW